MDSVPAVEEHHINSFHSIVRCFYITVGLLLIIPLPKMGFAGL